MKKTLFAIAAFFLLFSCSIDWNDEMKNKIIQLENEIENIKQENEIKCSEQARKTFELNTEKFEIKSFKNIYINNKCYIETVVTYKESIISSIIDVYTNTTLAENSVGASKWCFTPENDVSSCQNFHYNIYKNSLFINK